jgi:hypothetical protein
LPQLVVVVGQALLEVLGVALISELGLVGQLGQRVVGIPGRHRLTRGPGVRGASGQHDAGRERSREQGAELIQPVDHVRTSSEGRR